MPLIKTLGARTYRFSLSWPRIFPQGAGVANDKGLDFYDRLVDELLETVSSRSRRFITGICRRRSRIAGGWQSRDTAKAFADYAGYVSAKLSDRVRHFFTINELSTFVELGHGTGLAPGLKLLPARSIKSATTPCSAHGLAVQAIRASAKPGTKVGPAEKSPPPCQ